MIKKIKNARWFRLATNKYLITGVPFLVWMLFFDDNSWIMQRQLSAEISELQESIAYYSTELQRDKTALEELRSNPEAFEKYAREQFGMLRPGEEIYLIEFVEDE